MEAPARTEAPSSTAAENPAWGSAAARARDSSVEGAGRAPPAEGGAEEGEGGEAVLRAVLYEMQWEGEWVVHHLEPGLHLQRQPQQLHRGIVRRGNSRRSGVIVMAVVDECRP